MEREITDKQALDDYAKGKCFQCGGSVGGKYGGKFRFRCDACALASSEQAAVKNRLDKDKPCL